MAKLTIFFSSSTVAQNGNFTNLYLLTNMREIHGLDRHNEDPLKAGPTYSYCAPRVAFIFVFTEHLVQSLFLIVCCLFGTIIVETH